MLEKEIERLEESTIEEYNKIYGSMNFLIEENPAENIVEENFQSKITKYFESRKKLHLYEIKKEKLENIL